MLEPPNSYAIDLKQLEANLHHVLIKSIQTHEMHVQQIQGRCFLKQETKILRAATQHRQGLGVAICCYFL